MRVFCKVLLEIKSKKEFARNHKQAVEHHYKSMIDKIHSELKM